MTRRRSPSFVAGFVSVGTVKHVSEGAKHAIHAQSWVSCSLPGLRKSSRGTTRHKKMNPQSFNTIRLQVAPGRAKARPVSCAPRAAFGRGTPGDEGGAERLLRSRECRAKALGKLEVFG